MSSNSSRPIHEEIRAVFERESAAPEPQFTGDVVDALSRSRDAVVTGLEELAARGVLDGKTRDGTTVWWLSQTDPGATVGEDSERRRALFEHIQQIANVGAWEYDVRRDEGWGTDQIRRIHGIPLDGHVSPAESIEFYHPDDRQTIRDAFERALEDHEPYDLELRFVDATDTQRWVRVRGQVTVEDGEAVAVNGTMQDITERKRREKRLAQYRSIVENTHDGVFIVDTDRTLAYANEALLETIGMSRSAAEGTPMADLVSAFVDASADREQIRTVLDAVLEGTDTTDRTVQARVSVPSGERTVEYRFSPLETDQRRQAIVVALDVSEREEYRRRYETLVENFPNGAVTLVDDEMVYRLAGGELLDDLELTAAEVEGTSVEALPTGGRERIADAYRSALAGDETEVDVTVEDRALCLRVVPVYDDEGTVHAATGMTQDVTEKREREQQLERLSRAVEAAPTGITIADATAPDDPLTYVNDEFTAITGYDEADVVGRNCRFLQGEDTDPATVAQLRRAIDAEESVTVELRNYTKDGAEFWNRISIAPVENDDGEVINYVGFQQDVTERRRQQAVLEAREAALRRLQLATQSLAVADDERAVADIVVDCLTDIVEDTCAGVMWFDDEAGVLDTVTVAPGSADTDLPPVEPGVGPVWEAYAEGETEILETTAVDPVDSLPVESAATCLVVPVEKFGVLFATGTETWPPDRVDTVELLAASAAAVLQRLAQQREAESLSSQLATYEDRVAELDAVMDAIQAVQRRIAESDTRAEIESALCEELAATDRIDLAWVGYPQAGETDLTIESSAGRAQGYLDAIAVDDGKLPAQRAAKSRANTTIPNIAAHVQQEDWATAALSHGLRSVLSLPVVHDGVLYCVLTAYSTEEGAFDEIYEGLFEEFVSLLGSYIGITAQQSDGDQHSVSEFEFALDDPRYPLHALAAETGATIRAETVLETTADAVRLLVTVEDGDPETVLTAAEHRQQVTACGWFGDEASRQLSLTVERPFLATEVQKHGGRFAASVSDGESTTVRLHLPTTGASRPLVEALTGLYDHLELRSRTQTAAPTPPTSLRLSELLTDRQLQILRGAYYGGYYQTPREITAQELAADFGISHPVVYDHLQAAHRKLLAALLEAPTTTDG
jgi:PAS domain S-box-containing protein